MGDTIEDTLTGQERGIKSTVEENNNSKRSGDVPDYNHKLQRVCRLPKEIPLPWISPPSFINTLQTLCSSIHKRVGECKRSVFTKLNSVRVRTFRILLTSFSPPSPFQSKHERYMRLS